MTFTDSEKEEEEPVKYKVRYPSGAVKKKFYRLGGKLEGTYKMLYDNPSYGLNLREPAKAGKSYEDGQTHIKAEYAEGRRHGSIREYYPDGQLQLYAEYENGVEHGVFRQYYPNGQLEIETYYIHGLEVKHYKEWDENGKLITFITHR
jgi:hypothetical protein